MDSVFLKMFSLEGKALKEWFVLDVWQSNSDAASHKTKQKLEMGEKRREAE